MKKLFFLFSMLALLLATTFTPCQAQKKTLDNNAPTKIAQKAPATPAPADVAPAPASTPADAPADMSEVDNTAPSEPSPVLPDSIGTVKEFDGEKFIVVAHEVDATTGQAVAIWKEYKAGDESLMAFLLRNLFNGTLVILVTQFIKTSKSVKDFFGTIERPQRLAFFVSGSLAAAWIWISTGFENFTAVELAMKWIISFGFTLAGWEVWKMIKARFAKPSPTPTPTPA